MYRLFGTRHPNSDVPPDVGSYSQELARDDALAVLDHLEVERAHIVGLSMGGFATLHFGLAYPDRALSLTVCGCGYGAEPDTRDEFRSLSLEVASSFENRGAAGFASPAWPTSRYRSPRCPAWAVRVPTTWMFAVAAPLLADRSRSSRSSRGSRLRIRFSGVTAPPVSVG